MRWVRLIRLFCVAVLTLPVATPGHGAGAVAAQERERGFDTLIARAEAKGEVPVIVLFDAKALAGTLSSAATIAVEAPLHSLTPAQKGLRANAISTAQDKLLERLGAARESGRLKRLKYSSHIAMTVGTAALRAMRDDPGVLTIHEDGLSVPSLAESVPFIGAPHQWDSGYTGNGWTIAILDTGVDKTHPFLTGKVVSEACYSTTGSGSTSVCPGGVSRSTAVGSGVHCPVSVHGCNHGTHVAGIAAGRDPGGRGLDGVAKDAAIIAIQVFSRFSGSDCAEYGRPSCVKAWTSDIMLGLERVHELRATHRIASVNMSLAGARYSTYCDADPSKPQIDQLRAAGIATIVASGNDGYTNSLSAPACISSAVSVGATLDDADSIASFSNIASFISLLAPGRLITSSVPADGYASFDGTSMAAPHVAGAWAIRKQQLPAESVTAALDFFQQTGIEIDDNRLGGSVRGIRRINLGGAAPPVITLAEALDNDALSWSVSGDAPWGGQTRVSHDGSDAARSGAIGPNHTTRLTTTLTGPGILAFYWKVSSEPDADYLKVFLDGERQHVISGTIDWHRVSVTIPDGAHVVTWSYVKDWRLSQGSDTGWVDQVVYSATGLPTHLLSATKSGRGTVSSSPAGIDCGSDCSERFEAGTDVTLTATTGATDIFSGWSGACTGAGACVLSMTADKHVTATFTDRGIPIGQAVDNEELIWTSAGDAAWYGQTQTSFDGTDAARSGAISHSRESLLQTTVVGPGSLSFDWKVSSEQGFDYLSFDLDGISRLTISGEVGWERKTVAVPPGEHALQWSYTKDPSVDQGADAGWLDQIRFTPSTPQDSQLHVIVNGQGRVTSTPPGIDCGHDCDAVYPAGTGVALTAEPARGQVFARWSGACTGSRGCVVSMTQDQTVTARFTVPEPPVCRECLPSRGGWRGILPP